MDHADDTGVRAIHARCNASLQWLETWQYHLLPLHKIHILYIHGWPEKVCSDLFYSHYVNTTTGQLHQCDLNRHLANYHLT